MIENCAKVDRDRVGVALINFKKFYDTSLPIFLDILEKAKESKKDERWLYDKLNQDYIDIHYAEEYLSSCGLEVKKEVLHVKWYYKNFFLSLKNLYESEGDLYLSSGMCSFVNRFFNEDFSDGKTKESNKQV